MAEKSAPQISNKQSKMDGYKKKQVAFNQEWKCKKCSNILPPSYEIDHIIKRSDGGSNDIANLQALCNNCHGIKSWNENLNPRRVI